MGVEGWEFKSSKPTGSSLNVPDVLGDEVSAKELTGVNLVAEGPRLGDCLLVARLLSSPTVLPWLLLLVFYHI